MEYGKIISVTGLGGLFELLSSKADGAIVRSLSDKSTKFVSSRVHNFSHLESIEVYTVRDNVNLAEIFKAMESSNETLPNEGDNNAVRKYYDKVFPDLDFDRVYASDMKKMLKWFTILKANQVEITLPEPEPEPVEEAEVQSPVKKEPEPEKIKVEKPAKNPKKIVELKKEAVEPKKEEKTSKTPSKPKKEAKEVAKKSEKETPKKTAKKSAPKSDKKKKSGK